MEKPFHVSIICSLLWRASFIQYNFTVHLGCTSKISSTFVLLIIDIKLHRHATIYIFISLWICGLVWAIMNKTAINTCIQVLFGIMVNLLGYISQSENAWLYGNSIFEKLSNCFMKWLYHLTFQPAMFSQHSCQHFMFYSFLSVAILVCIRRGLVMVLIFIPLMTNVEHHFICLLAFAYYICGNVYLDPLIILKFYYLSVSMLYDTRSLSDTWFFNSFLLCVDFFFTFSKLCLQHRSYRYI